MSIAMPDTPIIRRDNSAPDLPSSVLGFSWYFIKTAKWLLLLMALLEAGQASFTLLLSYAVKGLLDGVAAMPAGANVYDSLEPAIWVFIWFNIGMVLCSRFSGMLVVIIGPRLRARIRETLFSYMQYHSQRYFMGNFSGSLANRINEVAMSIMHGLWTTMFDFWPIVITFAVSLFLLNGASHDLAVFLSCWIFVYIAVSLLLASHARKLSREFAAARSMVSGKVVDAMTNMMNIKMFARRNFEHNYIRDALEVEVSKARSTYWYMEIMRWFQFIAAFLLLMGLLLMALGELAAGALTPGEFAMVFGLSLLIINQTRGLSRSFLEFFEYMGNVADGVGIIVKSHDVVDSNNAKQLKVSKGRVVFDKVTFSYDGHQNIFKNLNLIIKSGQKIGLVGTSGAGKSTLVSLLLRMFDLQKGAIKIDNQAVSTVTQDSLREQVAVIPQDPMLFHRSLMENIRYGRIDATDKEVIAASKKAFCHEFILQQKKGYDALVGERGVKLSGGQRQRIAIARAILKNAPILILDEATSSLDSESEKYIQKSLEALMKDRTVIVVAHRLSTIAHLDRIIVLDKGKIIEDGSHHKLLENTDGMYTRLWGLQAGGFLPE